MQEMLRGPDNPLEQAVNNLCEAVKNCPALLGAKGIMTSPPISVQDYAVRLLAFCLVRAVPRNHEFTQRCIDQMKSALEDSKNHDSKGVEAIFDHMYFSDYVNHALALDDKEYGKEILKLSAHSIILAQRDCEQAFQEERAARSRCNTKIAVHRRVTAARNTLPANDI